MGGCVLTAFVHLLLFSHSSKSHLIYISECSTQSWVLLCLPSENLPTPLYYELPFKLTLQSHCMSLPPLGSVLSPAVLCCVLPLVPCACRRHCASVWQQCAMTLGCTSSITERNLFKMVMKKQTCKMALFWIVMCCTDVSQTGNGQSSSFFKSVYRLYAETKRELSTLYALKVKQYLSVPSSQTGNVLAFLVLLLVRRIDFWMWVLKFRRGFYQTKQTTFFHRDEDNKLL